MKSTIISHAWCLNIYMIKYHECYLGFFLKSFEAFDLNAPSRVFRGGATGGACVGGGGGV